MKKTLILCSILCTLLITFDPCAIAQQQQLIPLPTTVKWNKGSLNLAKGIHIASVGSLLKKESKLTESILQSWGISPMSSGQKGPQLKMNIDPSFGTQKPKGTYELLIDQHGIHIRAAETSGIFYALMTLRQFQLTAKAIPYCSIIDQPAFSWRGYLVDVGRNFQSVELLKEQIDVMAQYKLNVLHFHFTEDIAWRLESKQFPGLSAANNMTRWAGNTYSQADFQSLIDYCADRHITLLPEIDMPGHSAAFQRHFGVDMQSDSGITYIKALLSEFKQTYPSLTLLHIGGDEVKITNKNFLPQITQYVENLGYNTMGWEPGGNLQPQTIRQLWMGGPKRIADSSNIKYIDSKHLYINHMDILETVNTLFYRKIGEQDRESRNLLGATLCVWPDRNVPSARSVFYQNAVYPGMLTFAERSWRGGGTAGWISNLPEAKTPAFADFQHFENRLLQHKAAYFADKPFPYVKQTDMRWELVGPFQNQGKLDSSFTLEQDAFATTIPPAKILTGGTIVLRHWWNDVVAGAIDNPEPNTTWYARTKIWSDEAATRSFWIGFNDLSRSYASDSPAAGTWDDRQSTLWVNNQLIPAPVWQQPGLKGQLEVPLVDEGYSFRSPTRIQLKKGWNEVLIKLPVARFQGKTWDNPVKWMFTFIPLP